ATRALAEREPAPCRGSAGTRTPAQLVRIAAPGPGPRRGPATARRGTHRATPPSAPRPRRPPKQERHRMSDTLAPPTAPAPLTELRALAASYNNAARPGRRAHLAHLRAVYARGAASAPNADTAHLYGVTRAHAYLSLLASCSTPVNPLTPDRDLLPPHHPLSLRAP